MRERGEKEEGGMREEGRTTGRVVEGTEEGRRGAV